MDLKLDEHGDIAIENGDLVFVTGLDAIAQDITMKLRTWFAESVYDRTAGVPYLQVVFQRGTRIESIRFVVEQVIRTVPGVLDVLSLDTSRDTAARTLTLSGTVRASAGEVPFTVEVSA